jgi:hypothetical protein
MRTQVTIAEFTATARLPAQSKGKSMIDGQKEPAKLPS